MQMSVKTTILALAIIVTGVGLLVARSLTRQFLLKILASELIAMTILVVVPYCVTPLFRETVKQRFEARMSNERFHREWSRDAMQGILFLSIMIPAVLISWHFSWPRSVLIAELACGLFISFVLSFWISKR